MIEGVSQDTAVEGVNVLMRGIVRGRCRQQQRVLGPETVVQMQPEGNEKDFSFAHFVFKDFDFERDTSEKFCRDLFASLGREKIRKAVAV